MKHVPVSILAIIAIFGIAAMLSFAPFNVGPLAVRFVGPPVQNAGNTYVVALDTNEFIGSEVQSLSDIQLSRLASGKIHARDGATEYSQVLSLSESGLFEGGQLVFGSTEDGETGEFLQFEDSIFKLHLLFSNGLRSEVVENRLSGLEDESFFIMGDQYSILDTRVYTQSDSVTLKLYGGFGSLELTDGNYADDQFYPGVRINGKTIDAHVRIKAVETNEELSIYSIEYLLNAHPARGGSVEVAPLHCARNELLDPEGMLSPDFDICYKGQGAQSPAQFTSEVQVRPIGDDQYIIIAPNTRGQTYRIPLAQMPAAYGNRGRDFIFEEAANSAAPNIELGDYFLVNSKNDIGGSSHVLRYDHIADNSVYFEDLAGSSRIAPFGSTGEGMLLVGDGTYNFVVDATGELAMDQTNDGQINGAEARFVILGGSRLDFGPGFTITHTTPSRLFNEPAGDESVQFDITFNGQVDIDLPSPQGTFTLKSAGRGLKQGMTRYGLLWSWQQEGTSDSLQIGVGGQSSSSGNSGVFITLERPALVKTPAVCGDLKVNGQETCDPPGSKCIGAKPFERGICTQSCMCDK